VKRALLLVIPVAALVAFDRPTTTTKASGVPSPLDLRNDCGIVATEAAARLSATGAWTRIVTVKYTRDGESIAHSLVVWNPPTTSHVWAYDQWLLNGSLDTGVVLKDQQKDLPLVMAVLATASRLKLTEATYCK
jgi:hypothetical protein